MNIGKFTTIGFVGGGNFGKVFKALDTLLNVERAIKIIQVQNPQDFLDAINEAQILEKCRHNHIVDIKEIDIYKINGVDYPCITTEYLKNGSVQSYLDSSFITTRKAIQIVSEVLFGLEHAHSQGIYHRDIKPGNILFGDNGIVKLSDFGLAYGLSHQRFDFRGYNPHLPPEVLEGLAQDSLSDLYSMGITFHRLLNNMKSLPLPFANDIEWLNALKKEKYPIRKYQLHVPELVIKIAKKAIRADRDSRFQSCSQFRQAVEKVPLAIEWFPLDNDNWNGNLGQDKFELNLSSKRTGYFIEFKRNGRKIKNKCSEKVSDETTARQLFYEIIKTTTISY
jgi:serine/threonine protein kinase